MGNPSGSYSLRQNKFVDRRVFVDLLRHLGTARPIGDYAYIGLGGVTLEDHKSMFNDLGITKLVSLDLDPLTVRRQVFNMPVDSIRCLNLSTKECVDTFWPTLVDQEIEPGNPVIVWFDYTEPRKIYSQLQEAQGLVGLLQSGDVLRITVNAQPTSYYSAPVPEPGVPRENLAVTLSKRYEVMNGLLGEFMPEESSPEEMDSSGLAKILARAMRLAILGSLSGNSDLDFEPLCLTRYADGQQMLTMTGILLPPGYRETFLATVGLSDWPFFSQTWQEIHQINVPSLTLRERLFLDQIDIQRFDPAETTLAIDSNPERIDEIVRMYKKLLRHYPHFHHVQM